ncbi:MAG: MBL fold metallo-hydrolase [bacterium]|nr:MBL fold metallo-hydrolase [bacterium]
MSLIEIGPGISFWRGDRVNAGLVETSRGLVAIDALTSAEAATAMLAAAGRPEFLIYTHGHSDHVFGSGAFPPEVHVLATQATAGEITLHRERYWGPDLDQGVRVLEPDLVFTGQAQLGRGDRQLVIRHLGGHTPGSAVVWLPGPAVLFCGDLAVNGVTPFMLEADFDRWLTALAELASWRPAVVLPGHGDPAGPELLSRVATWLDSFRRQVREEGPGTELSALVDRMMARHGFPERHRFMVEGTVRALLGD